MAKEPLEQRFLLSLFALILTMGSAITMLAVFSPKKHGYNEFRSSPKDFRPVPVAASPRTTIRATQPVVISTAPVKTTRVTEQPQPHPVEPSNSVSFNEELDSAKDLVDNGNYLEAKTILEKILAADPNNEGALIELAMIHVIDLKDPASGLPHLEQAFRVNPENKAVLSELLAIYDDLGRDQEGLAYLQRLSEELPDRSTISAGLGQMLLNQDRIQEALPHLEIGAADGRDSGAMRDFADALDEAGQFDRSIEQRQKIISNTEEDIRLGKYDENPEAGQERLLMETLDLFQSLVRGGQEERAQEIMKEKLQGLSPQMQDRLRHLLQQQLSRSGRF